MMQRDTNTLHVLAFAGSLRANSFNRGLVRAAVELSPEGMTVAPYDLGDIPLYNQDLEKDYPPAVREFRARIAAADALLIATPEYNYSVPGVLKNAIDWASRPRMGSPLYDKPAAIMGAGGLFGTARAQLHLRQIASETNMLVLNKPEVLIQRAWEKFGADSTLADERSREAIRALLVALGAWTRRLGTAAHPRPDTSAGILTTPRA